jgi:hypothetical protein
MKLKFKTGWFKRAGVTKERQLELHSSEWAWQDDREIELDHAVLTKDELAAFTKVARAAAEQKEPGSFALEQKLGILRKLLDGDTASARVTDLQQLEAALSHVVRSLESRWVFFDDGGVMLPVVVTSVMYHPPTDDRQASTELAAAWYELGQVETRKWYWHIDDVVGVSSPGKKAGKTVLELLALRDLHLETPSAVEAYRAMLASYPVVSQALGKQYVGDGYAVALGEAWYERTRLPLVVDGVPRRLIIDDAVKVARGRIDDEEVRAVTSATVKSNLSGRRRRGGDDEPEEVVVAPLHPYVVAFDLTDHTYIKVLANLLTPYRYNKEVERLLVLPPDVKHVVSMLVDGAAARFNDIIAGKSLGTFILSTGPAGTGKTLTAEVYSERLERPLYAVQCSQLGTDEESLEKKLQPVLNRAQRWGAILLIDEADVYVRSRGEDIQQNAIVGVFLRLLERYRGVIFMTSNLDSIDDAIYSRATAHVRYELPDEAALAKIFAVQLELAGFSDTEATVVTDLCTHLAACFIGCSGRTAKQLVRLAMMQLGGALSSRLDEWVAAFEAIAKFQRLDASRS